MKNQKANDPQVSLSADSGPQKKILILGGGIMQIPAVRLALQKGWYVIVADGNPDAPARSLAHYFEEIDLRDHKNMIKAAQAWHEKTGIDGVFTAGTDFSVTVAKVAEAIGLPGIPVEAALNASDKSRMRKVLTEADLGGPRYKVISSLTEWDPKELAFPLVIKPVDNMGARGVCRLETVMEIEEAFNLACSYSSSGRVIIEEYLDGPEFSLDALVEGEKIVICGIADRDIRFNPYFVEMGHTMPTNADGPVINAVVEEFIKGIKALGINWGAAKGDIKWSHNRAVVGEIAARLSGGYMSGWTYPYASDLEPIAEALDLAVGLPLKAKDYECKRTSAERAFISIPGIIDEITGENEVKAAAGVQELFVLRSRGDEVTFPTNNVEKCGNVIAVHEKREKAVQAAEKGICTIIIRLKPGFEKTEKYLFGHKPEWIPEAFTLLLPENREKVSQMPLYLPWHDNMPVSETCYKAWYEDKKRPFSRYETKQPIYIAELPNLTFETGQDWHGMTMRQAINKVCDLTGCCFIKHEFATDLMQAASVQKKQEQPAGTESRNEQKKQEQPAGTESRNEQKKQDRQIRPVRRNKRNCSGKTVVLGRLFWTPFLRGGLQAGLWVIDTLMNENRIEEWESRWFASEK